MNPGSGLPSPRRRCCSVPSDEDFQAEQNGQGGGVLGYLDSLNRSNLMLGDMWGLRTELSKYGISFALQETSEVLGNVTGGARQGRRL